MFKNWHQSLREKTLHFQWLLFLLLKWLRGLEGKHVIINIYDLKLRTCFLAWRGDEMVILTHSCWKQWMRYRGGADVDGSSRPWTEVVFRASRNRFSAIIFHDYLHYSGIFLARFWITIVLKIISRLHIVFFLCARVGSCDVGTEFTNLIKVDEDVNEMSQLNI